MIQDLVSVLQIFMSQQCTCIIRKSGLSLSHMIRFLMDRMKIIISNFKKQTFISLKTNVCIKLSNS